MDEMEAQRIVQALGKELAVLTAKEARRLLVMTLELLAALTKAVAKNEQESSRLRALADALGAATLN